MSGLTQDEARRVEQVGAKVQRLRDQLRRRIVGLDGPIEELLCAVFAQGHSLLVGVPGLAKTLLISSISESLSLDFRRIQFTPDLMPSDITGTMVIGRDPGGERRFVFQPGPIFANIVLADEINRTPPKTQAALMEALEERQVTCAGTKYALPEPFFVLATQNPIEQEGTYQLPVAQLDRFMFMINVDYPSFAEEYDVMKLTTSSYGATLEPVFSTEEILEAHRLVRRVRVPDDLLRYAMALTRRTRSTSGVAPAFVREWLAWGGGPRATQNLLLGAKARALLQGRAEATAEDVRAVIHPAMRHRIMLSYHAEAEAISADEVITELVASTPAPDRRAAAG
ncbi:MAG: MoxR family ATPase [Planctomycetota bacterium]|nr:MoxR family ATPase [Planctomycetota bacterium]